MNNRILKSVAVVGLAAALFVACEDQVNSNKDAAGNAAQVQVSGAIGLPVGGALPGVDVFGNSIDAQGNVCVASNLNITANSELHNFVHVLPGVTITFAPGITIRGFKQGASAVDVKPGTLIVERGGQINAAGTSALPITFTSSNSSTPAPGDWGGIALLGKADANIRGSRGTTASGVDGVGVLEGFGVAGTTTPAAICGGGFTTPGRYGNGDSPALPASGVYNTDNSGTITYVRILYAGYVLAVGNELNGLTLAGVGSGTTINHVQVHKGLDDGFEFFGGTVNAQYLVSSKNADDDFDTDQGYAGKLQFGFVARAINDAYLADLPLNGGESNGDNDDNITTLPNTALTHAQFSNFTFVGPYQNTLTATPDQDYRAGLYFRDLSKQGLFNSLVLGFPYGVEVTNEGSLTIADQFNTASTLDANKINVRNTTIIVPAQSLVAGVVTGGTWYDAGANFDALFQSVGDNEIYVASSTTLGNNNSMAGANNATINTGTWNALASTPSLPTPFPLSGSPLLNAADFSLLSGFTVVTYRGAFDTTNNWMSGWTVWN